jgi:hypothetical protein
VDKIPTRAMFSLSLNRLPCRLRHLAINRDTF